MFPTLHSLALYTEARPNHPAGIAAEVVADFYLIKEMNPLKIKDELINKHRFYEFKMKQFLLALATGMRPAKIYNGTDSAVEGMLLTNGDGGVLCYHKSDRQTFADFLYRNTRFEKGSVDKDKYGFLERENGVYYFKLNVKIGLVKR